MPYRLCNASVYIAKNQKEGQRRETSFLMSMMHRMHAWIEWKRLKNMNNIQKGRQSIPELMLIWMDLSASNSPVKPNTNIFSETLSIQFYPETFPFFAFFQIKISSVASCQIYPLFLSFFLLFYFHVKKTLFFSLFSISIYSVSIFHIKKFTMVFLFWALSISLYS